MKESQLEIILTTLENHVARDVTKRVLLHTSGQSPKKSHADAMNQIKALFLELIGEDDPAYQPYLVVRHKLGLEENQEQAKIITACVNKSRQELRQKVEEL